MAVYECRWCKYQQDTEWTELCPSCKGIYRCKKVGADSDEQKQRSTFAAAAKSTKVYIPTGIVGFDRTIGGGFVAGSPILIGGFRGVGKTTLLCMVAAAIAEVKGGALYASSEESAEGVLSVAHRLGLRSENVEVLGNQLVVEKVIDHAKKTKPFLIVFDSLQKYVSLTSNGSPGSIAQDKAVGAAVLDYCRETKRCAVVVNQMTNAGEMKGATDAAHAVDTVLVFAYPKDDDEETPDEPGIRALVVDGKNRNGDENAKSYWRMTETGMLEEVQKRSKLIEFPRRGRYRKREDEDDARD